MPDKPDQNLAGDIFEEEDIGFSKIRAKERLYSNVLIGVIGFVLLAAAGGYWVKESLARNEYGPTGDYLVNSDEAIYANYAGFGGYNSASGGCGASDSFGCGGSGSISTSGGSGSSGGGCCGSSGGSLASGVDFNELERLALEKFKQDTGIEQEVTAKAGDFGCHLQIDIKDKNSNIIKSYGYKGDSLYVIR